MVLVYKDVETSQNKNLSTPQSEPVPGREADMKANNAGGYGFKVDDWTMLDRFLILGTEGGTYYVKAKKLTKDNAEALIRCIKADGLRAVKRIIEISDEGRAAKNDPAIFALAVAASVGDEATKAAALFSGLPQVCRTATHLFVFCEYVQQFRGWGHGLRKAVAAWYQREPQKVAYQAVKYQSREGWTHRDLLRLSHPKPTSDEHKLLYRWITRGPEDTEVAQGLAGLDASSGNPDLAIIAAAERAKKVGDNPKELVALIQKYRLPREALPTEALNSLEVWEALLESDMPMTAMIRNLAKMTSIGLLTKGGSATRKVIDQLGNVEHLKKTRIHPITLLSALKVYEQGHGEKGSLEWSPVSAIVDALDEAFYAAFKAIVPSNKNLFLAVDISGSMDGNPVVGLPGIDARMAAAALALVTAATEPNTSIYCFERKLSKLVISPNERLDGVIRKMKNMTMGGTDCSLPMTYALEHKLPVDGFVTYTDSETWAGSIHVSQALRNYRSGMGRSAKMVVAAFTATDISIADPDDAGQMDCVGLDSSTPAIISDFLK